MTSTLRLTIFLAVTLVAINLNGVSQRSRTTSPCSGLNDCAYTVLNNRVLANQQSFYVYQDADSGFNHGLPQVVTQPSNLIVNINAACIDDPSSSDGCSSNTQILDRNRGTVFAITFPPISSGQYANVYFYDSSGYNLSGSNQVEFDARSPSGSTVYFYVNGCRLAIATLTQSWEHIPLSLSGCSVSQVQNLFTVSTNSVDQNPSYVLLDNIQFTPNPTRQMTDPKALSFPLSTQTFGVIPQQNSSCPQNPPCFPPDQVNRNITTIYESALTVLALLQRGQQPDITNVEELAKTFNYALYHDNHGDYLPTQPGAGAGCYGGSGNVCGLHSSYSSGDIAFNSGQSGGGGAQAGDVRLAGFSATSCNTGFCLVSDGATGGNNAYGVLALLATYQATGNPQYLNDAITIGNWIYTNLYDPDPHGYGGYFAGYFGYGDCPPPPASCQKGVVNLSKSVENNADIYAAYSLLAQIEGELGSNQLAGQYTGYANVAGDFVMRMYNSTTGGFNLGTINMTQLPPPGTAGICPDFTHTMDNDVLNTCPFLDANTFAILALGGSTRYAGATWDTAMQYVLNAGFAQQITAAEQTFDGFDLVMTPTYGANGVAWEFAGQAVEAMGYVDQIYSGNAFESAAAAYLQQIRQAQLSAPFGDGASVVASTLQNGDNLPPYVQCLGTPFQCIPERPGLAATAWAIFSQLQINPEIGLPAFNTYTLTLAAIPSGSGTITAAPAPTNGGYASGTEVCLTATPNQGFYFSAWMGDQLNSRNCLLMTANKSVTAIFAVYTAPAPAQYAPLPPCRLVDTRKTGNPVQGGIASTFDLPQLAQSAGCGSLLAATVYSLNVTVIPHGRLGYLTVWPTGEQQPFVSLMNSLDGRIKANAAIVPGGTSGEINVYATNTTDLLLDIDGYFTPPSGSTLMFYPVTPCRVVDTRNSDGDLGGPFLTGNQERDFPVLESMCIPPGVNPAAYSFNVTAVPHPTGQRLGFMTVWPQGQLQPTVSTLNNTTGTIVANAAIVLSGTGGGVAVYPNNNTDLLIDINGYFAPAGTGGLSLYPLTPCRVIDTRPPLGSGAFDGTMSPPVNVVNSACGAPGTAEAYVFNATVVPPGPLGFLTLWPDGENQPDVSTLNAKDGAITSNMAIVPTSNGYIDAYANALTQLILDISSYFAP